MSPISASIENGLGTGLIRFSVVVAGRTTDSPVGTFIFGFVFRPGAQSGGGDFFAFTCCHFTRRCPSRRVSRGTSRGVVSLFPCTPRSRDAAAQKGYVGLTGPWQMRLRLGRTCVRACKIVKTGVVFGPCPPPCVRWLRARQSSSCRRDYPGNLSAILIRLPRGEFALHFGGGEFQIAPSKRGRVSSPDTEMCCK